MLARRTAVASTEPFSTPDFAAVERATVRVASGAEAPIASPVHALQAELAELAESLNAAVPHRIDPGKVIVGLTLAVYLAAFWWGVASVGSTWLHHVLRH